MVSNFCLCINDEGEVKRSSNFHENLSRILFTSGGPSVTPPSRQFEEFEDPCSNGDSLVFNALDFYEGFFGWCNAYDHEQQKQKICKVEDKVEKVIRMLKKSKKSKRSSKKRYY